MRVNNLSKYQFLALAKCLGRETFRRKTQGLAMFKLTGKMYHTLTNILVEEKTIQPYLNSLGLGDNYRL